jgi:N-acylneuraminate cytidylyltransferase
MKSVAVIPARMGSKRIPSKNMLEFNGIPNIVRAIKLAQNSHLFERIIVSTDSEEIAYLAQSSNAEVPFIRSAELSDDFTGTSKVIQDVLKRVPGLNSIEFTCCIYPVTPMLKTEHLKAAFSKLKTGDADYIVAAIADRTPIYRHFQFNSCGKIDLIFPSFVNTRTQDLPKTFADAGQFYFGRTKAWLEEVPLLSDRSEAIEFSNTELVDIDTWEDWKIAEAYISIRDKEKGDK